MHWALATVAMLALGGLQTGEPAGLDADLTGPATLPLLDDLSSTEKAGSPPSLPSEPSALSPGVVVQWQGTCPCPASSFPLDVGSGWDGWLEVRVRWDGSAVRDLGLTVEGPDGARATGNRGFDDRLARLWSLESGDYEVAITGTGAFQATARLETLRTPSQGALLPNLVELIPEGPHIGGCDEVERVEQGAVKCLRFGNGVGNDGDGPVQVRLNVKQGGLALATEAPKTSKVSKGGYFEQEIRQASGAVASHRVGPADFHPAHGHWHYDGLALFDLHAVDPSTGLRVGKVATHHKAGFCFLDWDRMPENTTRADAQERAEADCLVPWVGQGGSWTNGISRGWYDFYESGLTDQYVDVAGLPNGLYELVATADPLDTLDETDETDNQSSLVVRLTGNVVQVVEERGHHRVQPADDA